MVFPDKQIESFQYFHDLIESLPILPNDNLFTEVYQNERRRKNSWNSKHLCDFDVAPFSSVDGLHSAQTFPKKRNPPGGYTWLDSWRPSLTEAKSDSQGWCYAPGFKDLIANENISPTPRIFDFVRRRRWIRSMKKEIVDYKWKEDRLGISLIESTKQVERMEKIEWLEEETLGITLSSAGADEAALVKHVERTDLNIKVGQKLMSVNGKSLENMAFREIMDHLLECKKPATLEFASLPGEVVARSIISPLAKKTKVKPGYVLIGINNRSVENMTLFSIEHILRVSPKNSCVLHFRPPIDCIKSKKLSRSTTRHTILEDPLSSDFQQRSSRMSFFATGVATLFASAT